MAEKSNMSKKTPCEKLGYEIGDQFEVMQDDLFGVGSVVVLDIDDNSDCPLFKLVKGSCSISDNKAYCDLDSVRKIDKTRFPTPAITPAITPAMKAHYSMSIVWGTWVVTRNDVPVPLHEIVEMLNAR